MSPERMSAINLAGKYELVNDQERNMYFERAGRIEMIPSKPCSTQRDLALAYTPGVALPCEEIHNDPANAYRYTNKGNLVAVVTNGTAVPGLGDIGPHAAKPFMESLVSVYKTVADLDLFDLEISSNDPDEFVMALNAFQPSFGGILVVGIKAPDCYHIGSLAKQRQSIPVLLESTGVAVAMGAAVLNISRLLGKSLEQLRFSCIGKNELKKAFLKHLSLLGINSKSIDLYKSDSLEFGMLLSRDYDVLIFFEDQPEFILKGFKELKGNPLIILANKKLSEIVPVLEKIKPDAIIVPFDPILKNGIDGALSCPYLLRHAMNNRFPCISAKMLISATYAIANAVNLEELTRTENPIICPEIMNNNLYPIFDYHFRRFHQ